MPFRFALALLLLVALSACNLSTESQNAPTPTIGGGGQPTVVINSPATGSTVPLSQPVIVNVTATDSIGITRVQLLANGAVAKTVSSQTAGGDRSLNVLLDYTPTLEGTLNLQVIAYRGSVVSAPATVSVTVQRTATATATNRPVVTSGPVINPNDPTCRIVTDTSVNLRSGPGTVYAVLTTLGAGAVAPITGRLGDNTWWQVRYGSLTGWVSDAFVTIYGICTNVIIPPIPPTPTPRFTPSFTWTNQPAITNTPTPSTTPGLADLVISNISGATELQIPNGQTSITAPYAVTITNTGQRSSGQFNNIVTVLPASTTYQLGVVGDLQPGQSVLLNINLTFTTGAYTLQARTDSDSQIAEQSEVNNVGIFTLNVLAPMAMNGGSNTVSGLQVITLDPALVPAIISGT